MAAKKQTGARYQWVLFDDLVDGGVKRCTWAPENGQLVVTIGHEKWFSVIGGAGFSVLVKEEVEDSESEHVDFIVKGVEGEETDKKHGGRCDKFIVSDFFNKIHERVVHVWGSEISQYFFTRQYFNAFRVNESQLNFDRASIWRQSSQLSKSDINIFGFFVGRVGELGVEF
jgi:hypothetical protein